MKAINFPGAARAARRAFGRRGRRRVVLTELHIGMYDATFRILGVGTVRVPTVRIQRRDWRAA